MSVFKTVFSHHFFGRLFSQWLKLAALSLAILGLGIIAWSSQALLTLTSIPECIYPVDELVNSGIDSELPATSSAQSGLGQIQVEISGAVLQPGVYWTTYSSRLGQVIELAGGLTKQADFEFVAQHLNLATKVTDEAKIFIPFKEEAELNELISEYCASDNYVQTSVLDEESDSDSSSSTKDNQNDSGQDSISKTCISLNHASNNELQQLSGVGEKRATDIIQNRPFTNIDELLDIDGIGEASLTKWRDNLCL